MKVLLLRRQRVGGIATLSDALAATLPRLGVSTTVEDGSDWIPNETGIREGKAVSKRLRALAERFDIVHAFGYRTAWACSEAFGHKEAWVYTAYDMPKTTHRLLIDKLNDAQLAESPSYAVSRALEDANALDIHVHLPGVIPPSTPPSKAEARSLLEVDPEAHVIGCLGRFVPERGFGSVIRAMEEVWADIPDAQLLISGEGPLAGEFAQLRKEASKPEAIRLFGRSKSKEVFLAALDLLVVPSTRAGFSMTAVEAMLQSVPVLMRNRDGLPEIAEPDISGFLFDTDDELGGRIARILKLSLTLEAVGLAGKVRAGARFDMDRYAQNVRRMYEEILEG